MMVLCRLATGMVGGEFLWSIQTQMDRLLKSKLGEMSTVLRMGIAKQKLLH